MSVGVKIIIFFCMITHYVKPFSDTHRWIRYTPQQHLPPQGGKSCCHLFGFMNVMILHNVHFGVTSVTLKFATIHCLLFSNFALSQFAKHNKYTVSFVLPLFSFASLFFLFIWRMSNLGSIMTVITFWLTGNHLRWDHGHRHSVSVLFVIFMFSNIELRWVHHYPYMYLNCFDYVWHFHTNILGVNPVTTGLPQLRGYHHHSKPCLWCSKFPGSGNCRCIS